MVSFPMLVEYCAWIVNRGQEKTSTNVAKQTPEKEFIKRFRTLWKVQIVETVK